MKAALDVVTYGEAMAMFVATGGHLAHATQFTKRVAGADLNVAIGLSRLGFRVGWMSRVGRDSFGGYVLDTLAREGIDASCVTVDPRYPTGFQLVAQRRRQRPDCRIFSQPPRATCRATTTWPTTCSARATCT